MSLFRKLRLFSGLILFLIAIQSVSYAEILDRVVAVVNDDVITQSEVDVLLRPWYEQFKNRYQGDELAVKLNEVRRNLLNQLIEDKLVYQEAVKRNIEISESEIDERVQEFKSRFKTEEDFVKIMNAQGMTMTKLRERYRQQMAIRRLHLIEIKSKVFVSPLEIEDYYSKHSEEFNKPERVKLKSITIRKSSENQGKIDDDARTKAEQILTDLKKGANFTKIAEAHSEDYNASSGGDLGFVGRGELAKNIDEIVFALNPGDLSPVIESDIGYHIFKVEEREDGKKLELEEVRDQLKEYLIRIKSKERFEEWMKQLKEKAYISIR